MSSLALLIFKTVTLLVLLTIEEDIFHSGGNMLLEFFAEK